MSEMTFYVHGEWEDEPDFEEFVHAELPCIVVRIEMGHLCGYVGVPPGHPAYPPRKKDLNEFMRKGLQKDDGDWEILPKPDMPVHMADVSYHDIDVDVHGGLTWSEMGDNYYGRREGFKWYGFDCAHYMDYRPPTNKEVWEIEKKFPMNHVDETYRNWEYVKGEVKHLAEQLAAMWEPPSYKEYLEQAEEILNDRRRDSEGSVGETQQREEH